MYLRNLDMVILWGWGFDVIDLPAVVLEAGNTRIGEGSLLQRDLWGLNSVQSLSPRSLLLD